MDGLTLTDEQIKAWAAEYACLKEQFLAGLCPMPNPFNFLAEKYAALIVEQYLAGQRLGECSHKWVVVEASRSVSEYTGLESGTQICTECNETAHFTRDRDPHTYPHG